MKHFLFNLTKNTAKEARITGGGLRRSELNRGYYVVILDFTATCALLSSSFPWSADRRGERILILHLTNLEQLRFLVLLR